MVYNSRLVMIRYVEVVMVVVLSAQGKRGGGVGVNVAVEGDLACKRCTKHA